MNINELRDKSFTDLVQIAESLYIDEISRANKDEIVYSILTKVSSQGDSIYGEGVLEVLDEGFGFLRSSDDSYLPSKNNIFVSNSQIKRFNLKTGDTLYGTIKPPKGDDKYFAILKLEKVNYDPINTIKDKIPFNSSTPIFADEQLRLERGTGTKEDLTGRIIDFIAPIGKGQRGLIVATPKAGKTIILQSIAHAIVENNPECHLIVLLIDERPEEVTEMERSVRGQVISSTFDESPERHVKVAEMVIERAKSLVEHKRDVVILLDSITRLARAYNTVVPSSGKILTGGIDANALQKPKRFFGAARNVEEGGSLTIIATALIDTGSKMDEVIFEEFKGTGNMELHLDRNIAERRIFPAINVNKSGTRREERLMDDDELNNAWIIRNILHDMQPVAAIKFVIDKMTGTKTNKDFFQLMKR